MRDIEAEAARYPARSAAAIDALQIVQRHRGWVSDEAIQELSAFLGVSAADLDAVASFYNLIYRRPVGRHVIHVCDSISCWIVGYNQVRDALFANLGIGYGETTRDQRFTLLPTVCLGCCDRAPAMIVDGQLHTGLDPRNVTQALEQYE